MTDIVLTAPSATVYKGDDTTLAFQLQEGGVPWPIPATPLIEFRFRPASGATPVSATLAGGEITVVDAHRGKLSVNLSDEKTALLMSGGGLPVVAVVTAGGITRTFELASAITVRDRTLGT